jgi:hypothetical protein
MSNGSAEGPAFGAHSARAVPEAGAMGDFSTKISPGLMNGLTWINIMSKLC